MGIPVIDLSGFEDGSDETRRRIANDLDRACTEVGFFSLVGHGVDDDVVLRAHDAARRFFALPLDDRLTAAKPDPTYPYGFAPFSSETLHKSLGGVTRPDLKEAYSIGPPGAPPRPHAEMTDPDERDVWAPTIWPSAMPELQPALVAYYNAMAQLARTVMNAFAHALHLGDGWFDPLIDHHASALRLAYYPPLEARPAEAEFRAGAHTDYGTLTILRLDAEPGLQVLDHGGAWIDVDAPDGAMVVNLGDLMQRWTNDRWRSTMHRVVVPDGRHAHDRLTMPFFHNANWDACVEAIVATGETPRYEPIVAGAHLMEKFRSTVR